MIEGVVNLSMSDFRLDKTKFKAQTAQEAGDHSSYYRSLTWQERLRISAYLNSVAYNYPLNDPPKMDKTVFKARSLKS
jgi:hypothetical protein